MTPALRWAVVVMDKVTRQYPYTQLLKRKESRSGFEPRSFCFYTQSTRLAFEWVINVGKASTVNPLMSESTPLFKTIFVKPCPWPWTGLLLYMYISRIAIKELAFFSSWIQIGKKKKILKCFEWVKRTWSCNWKYRWFNTKFMLSMPPRLFFTHSFLCFALFSAF